MVLIYTSREFERSTEFSDNEIISKKWYGVNHKDDKEILIQYLENRTAKVKCPLKMI